MSEWARRLSQELPGVEALFHPNELAYLALTQKGEHAIRDRLAFSLYSKWSERESLLVAREWNRVDLAIIRDSSPLLLLETKAIYTFDILKGKAHDYPDSLINDVKKRKPFRSSNTEICSQARSAPVSAGVGRQVKHRARSSRIFADVVVERHLV